MRLCGPGTGLGTPGAPYGFTRRLRRSWSAMVARCRTITPHCSHCPVSGRTRRLRSRPSRSASGTRSWTPMCAVYSPEPSRESHSRASPPQRPTSGSRRPHCRLTSRQRPAGRLPRWNWVHWSAPRVRRAAATARSVAGALGSWPAVRRTTVRRGRGRPTKAPIARCAVACSPSYGPRRAPYRRRPGRLLARRNPARACAGRLGGRRPGRSRLPTATTGYHGDRKLLRPAQGSRAGLSG